MKVSVTMVVGKWLNLFHRMLHVFYSEYRSACMRTKFGAVGKNVQLASDLLVDFPDRIGIGDWVYVGPGGQFFGRGGLTIADHVLLGPQVTIMTSQHNYKDARFIPYDEVELLDPVKIGEACWIGFGAIVMPGVVLGQGCIVGAGSVVTKSFPDGSIIAGNPGKVIGERDMCDFVEKLRNDKTYLKRKSLEGLKKIERSVVGD